MNRQSCISLAVFTLALLACGTDVRAMAQSQAYRESILDMQVKEGVITTAQKDTIVKNWNMLEQRGKEAGFKLIGFSYGVGGGEKYLGGVEKNTGSGEKKELGVVGNTSVDFTTFLLDKTFIRGSLSLNNTAENITIQINSQLTSTQKKELLDILSKTCLIGEKEVNTIMEQWEANKEKNYSFTTDNPCKENTSK